MLPWACLQMICLWREISNQVLSLPMGPHLDAASVKIVTQTILNEGANA
jgi:hypothetical protein